MSPISGSINVCTADLYDAFHETVDVCALQFRSYGKHRTFFGPAVTLVSLEDHTPVLATLSEPGLGRVLVVDGGGSMRIGVLGDRLAGIAANNNWAGIVVNGVVRDSNGIDNLDIGIKALGPRPVVVGRRLRGAKVKH